MSASKASLPWAPTQSFLLPPSPLEWLPDGHVSYFVLDVVGQLDLSRIKDAMGEKESRGTRPYSPQMMVTLLLYGYAVGVFSSRKLEQATYESIPTSRPSTPFASGTYRSLRSCSYRF